MISKVELKRIASARLRDAETLLLANRFDGATYLCGYAVELSLKLRICKTLRWNGFPETNAEFRDLQSFRTHDFDALLRLSGIEDKVKSQYFAEWFIVKQWKPELRYSRTGSASVASTNNLISATIILLKAL
jgi:hypothetical protein